MKNLLKIFLFLLLIQSCEKEKEISSISAINWDSRSVGLSKTDSLLHGTTYLSVYSQIYSLTEHRTHNLTAIVSMRNTNRKDSIYINKAEYFGTNGHHIRTYFEKTIYIAPMETVEIVIDEIDQDGGTGPNFVFEWSISHDVNEPLFEGIMISTSGQQGLSFTTQGVRIK
ncbi:MAG: DUF3124 domain-containing protein [Aestuariibaculum sp.]